MDWAILSNRSILLSRPRPDYTYRERKRKKKHTNLLSWFFCRDVGYHGTEHTEQHTGEQRNLALDFQPRRMRDKHEGKISKLRILRANHWGKPQISIVAPGCIPPANFRDPFDTTEAGIGCLPLCNSQITRFIKHYAGHDIFNLWRGVFDVLESPQTYRSSGSIL